LHACLLIDENMKTGWADRYQVLYIYGHFEMNDLAMRTKIVDKKKSGNGMRPSEERGPH
jgi:hypothetical protein